MPSLATSLLKIFADDTKAYLPIQSIKHRDELQHTIDKLVEWSNIWLLKFNGGECKVLHVGKYNPNYKCTIAEDGVIKDLEVTTCEQILGVFVDELLNFDNHMITTVKKARSLSGLIIRTITCKTKKHLGFTF